MPQMETAWRFQKAVVFPKALADDYGEERTGTPFEVRVRWVHHRRKSMDAQGNTVMLDATVVADRVIDPGSKMWLGELADWYGTGSGSGDPDLDTELMEVMSADVTSDVKNRNKRYTMGLRKYRYETPERV